MEMTVKQKVKIKQNEENTCDSSIVCKGGESITPLTNTNYKDFSLEGLEFWCDQGIYAKTGLEVKLDYFAFNIPGRYIAQDYADYELGTLIDVLKLKDVPYDCKCNYSEVQMITRINRAYSDSTNIFINDSKRVNAFLEDEYMIRIELKGEGCREFERRGGNWKTLIDFIINKGGYTTIIDIATDDKIGYITDSELDYLIRNRYFRSLFKTYRDDGTKKCKDKVAKGWGYHFGGLGSSTKLRIYNKILQQMCTGKAVDVSIKHWIRYEMRFMYDKAKSMMYILRDNIMNLEEYAVSLLSGCIQFLKPNKKDDNKSRWEVYPKWEKMLGDISKSKVKVDDQFKSNSCIYSINDWIKRSCTKSLMINELVLDDEELIKSQLEFKLIGLLKLKNIDLNMINEFRREKMLSSISMKDVHKKVISTADELKKYHTERSFRNFKEDLEKMFHCNYEYLINVGRS